MTALENAAIGLRQALDAPRQALEGPRRHHMWRWLVRHRIAAVKEALSREYADMGDASLAARELTLRREREVLLRRLCELGPQVLDAADVEPVRQSLHRLLCDLDRYRQRVNDLAYDTVSLELGGSE